ncbi:unnamed protein product [Gongylonema pulchrum]|uniref:CARMIL_C domain-containing protein n=1 Tax=Gongylonema pulchrum TaxID=637853 RepID=A0A183DDM0_9BILA|nr:unnamed protein product [Gongylonema pulchrum]
MASAQRPHFLAVTEDDCSTITRHHSACDLRHPSAYHSSRDEQKEAGNSGAVMPSKSESDKDSRRLPDVMNLKGRRSSFRERFNLFRSKSISIRDSSRKNLLTPSENMGALAGSEQHLPRMEASNRRHSLEPSIIKIDDAIKSSTCEKKKPKNQIHAKFRYTVFAHDASHIFVEDSENTSNCKSSEDSIGMGNEDTTNRTIIEIDDSPAAVAVTAASPVPVAQPMSTPKTHRLTLRPLRRHKKSGIRMSLRDSWSEYAGEHSHHGKKSEFRNHGFLQI